MWRKENVGRNGPFAPACFFLEMAKSFRCGRGKKQRPQGILRQGRRFKDVTLLRKTSYTMRQTCCAVVGYPWPFHGIARSRFRNRAWHKKKSITLLAIRVVLPIPPGTVCGFTPERMTFFEEKSRRMDHLACPPGVMPCTVPKEGLLFDPFLDVDFENAERLFMPLIVVCRAMSIRSCLIRRGYRFGTSYAMVPDAKAPIAKCEEILILLLEPIFHTVFAPHDRYIRHILHLPSNTYLEP